MINNYRTVKKHMSECLDFHLNSLVSGTKSYVEDTNHFLQLLDRVGRIRDNALLCTAYVVGQPIYCLDNVNQSAILIMKSSPEGQRINLTLPIFPSSNATPDSFPPGYILLLLKCVHFLNKMRLAVYPL